MKAYNTLNNYGGIIAGGGSGGSGSYPKLFVNILLFDKDYNFLDAAWEQIDGGEQVGATPKAAHDLMSKEVTVKEAGFAYVFISNENPTLVEFYVDDVVITHTPTNVIQYNEYYPFGLQTSSSWTRDNTKDNNYLYNAANELNKTSGWYEMYYRGYDPAIGRMLQIDPYAPLYASYTTYNYAVNNPIMISDPNGGQVDVTGLTNSQVRSLYLADRWHSDSGDFSDWASDNATGTTLDGGYFGSVTGGRWALFEYYYTDKRTGQEDPEAGYYYQWEFIPDPGPKKDTYKLMKADGIRLGDNGRAQEINLKAKAIKTKNAQNNSLLSTLISVTEHSYRVTSTNFRGKTRWFGRTGLPVVGYLTAGYNIMDAANNGGRDAALLEAGKGIANILLGPEMDAVSAFNAVGEQQMPDIYRENMALAQHYNALAHQARNEAQANHYSSIAQQYLSHAQTILKNYAEGD